MSGQNFGTRKSKRTRGGVVHASVIYHIERCGLCRTHVIWLRGHGRYLTVRDQVMSDTVYSGSKKAFKSMKLIVCDT